MGIHLKTEIFTENKNLGGIHGIIGKYFSGYTVTQAYGFFEGKPEDSIIITICHRPADTKDIVTIKQAIGILNDQKSVLVATTKLHNILF